MARGGAQRPVRCVDEPKKMGARSAWAHARPKPTSVGEIYFMYRIRTLFPAHKKNAGDQEIGHESIRYVI